MFSWEDVAEPLKRLLKKWLSSAEEVNELFRAVKATLRPQTLSFSACKYEAVKIFFAYISYAFHVFSEKIVSVIYVL